MNHCNERITYKWDNNQNKWLPYNRTTYAFNNQEYHLEKIEQNWDSEKNVWQNLRKCFYTDWTQKYNLGGCFTWINNEWDIGRENETQKKEY